LRGCPRTRGFFGLQREHPATGDVRDSFRLISEFLQHCDRYLSHRELVQGTAQDAFVSPPPTISKAKGGWAEAW
jgi:hypothetical protein